MEISKEKLDEINRALQEHLRRKREDPKYRAECERMSKGLHEYYNRIEGKTQSKK